MGLHRTLELNFCLKELVACVSAAVLKSEWLHSLPSLTRSLEPSCYGPIAAYGSALDMWPLEVPEHSGWLPKRELRMQHMRWSLIRMRLFGDVVVLRSPPCL